MKDTILSKEMKNRIVTCINNQHPIYLDSLKSIKVGKSYECIDEITLTADTYFKPEFASLKGITIKRSVGKWGWERPCLPKECFRIATPHEVRVFKVLHLLNMPFRFGKILFFKTIHKIDRIVRAKYYKQLLEEYNP